METSNTNKEYNSSDMLDFGQPIEDQSQNIIKVIGVGGAGCNAVRNMYAEGIEGITYAICNTDSAALSKSRVPVKIQLGAGLGAGGNPELGRSEAEANLEDIEGLIDERTKMVFVTAGMGGGTGTGAAPVVAKVAKEKGILTIGVVTIPFYFEQKRKIIKALKGVEEMRKNVDAMLIINNERLCDIYSDTPVTLQEAFKRADNVLKDAVKGISELITISSEGDINLDFRDVESTLRNGGGAIMAIGRASGERRVERAILNALDSPLLYGNDIGKAKRILFDIYASEDCPYYIPELNEITEFFEQLNPEIEVIWGTTTDNSLGEDAKVIILAADLEDELRGKEEKVVPDNADDYYASLIPKLYKPLKKEVDHQPAIDPTVSSSDDDPKTEETPTEESSLPETPIQKATPVDSPEEDEEQDQEEELSPEAPIVDRWKQWLKNKINILIDPEE